LPAASSSSMLHIEVGPTPPAAATTQPTAHHLLLFIMLLHVSCCFCSGLQVASSKQQQHAAHRGGSSTASSGHSSSHSPPNPGGCESAVPAQRPSCSPAAHVIQDAWEDHRSACHRLTALSNSKSSPSCISRCSLGCRNITLMYLLTLPSWCMSKLRHACRLVSGVYTQ